MVHPSRQRKEGSGGRKRLEERRAAKKREQQVDVAEMWYEMFCRIWVEVLSWGKLLFSALGSGSEFTVPI